MDSFLLPMSAVLQRRQEADQHKAVRAPVGIEGITSYLRALVHIHQRAWTALRCPRLLCCSEAGS